MKKRLVDFSPFLAGSIFVVLLNLTYYFLINYVNAEYPDDFWIILTNFVIIALIIILQIKNIKQISLAERVKYANEEKANFLANMSHELRTPLNSIIGFSELLIDGNSSQSPDERLEFLHIINDSSQLLLQLINDVLSITRIESGGVKIEKKEFSILDVIDQCNILNQKGLATHRFVVDNKLLPQDIKINGDPRLILQVLINLVGNAIKFSQEGKPIGINLSRNLEELQITVWDEGIGINKADFDRLFKAFSQLESPLTKKYQGTGLGLYICKNIVERHGGRIWVESIKDQGSRFSFTIPYSSSLDKIDHSAEVLMEKLWEKTNPN